MTAATVEVEAVAGSTEALAVPVDPNRMIPAVLIITAIEETTLLKKLYLITTRQ